MDQLNEHQCGTEGTQFARDASINAVSPACASIGDLELAQARGNGGIGAIMLPAFRLVATMVATASLPDLKGNTNDARPIAISLAAVLDVRTCAEDELLDRYVRIPDDAFDAALWNMDLGEPVMPSTKKSDKPKVVAAVQAAIAEAKKCS